MAEQVAEEHLHGRPKGLAALLHRLRQPVRPSNEVEDDCWLGELAFPVLDHAKRVVLTDSSASAALAATAGKASGATANPAPTAAAAAPVKGSIAAAGRGTQKMSDEELPEPPSYADL